jgi:N utilization substance protein B
MSRRELREHIFKLLFRIEFNERAQMPEQLRLFFEDDEMEFSELEQAEIQVKFDRINDKLEELDRMINDKATRWNTDRMGKVDLAILRLAVYEICFDEDIPTLVAINEAVELAKKFGQDESPAFINGVLAKFAG